MQAFLNIPDKAYAGYQNKVLQFLGTILRDWLDALFPRLNKLDMVGRQ